MLTQWPGISSFQACRASVSTQSPPERFVTYLLNRSTAENQDEDVGHCPQHNEYAGGPQNHLERASGEDSDVEEENCEFDNGYAEVSQDFIDEPAEDRSEETPGFDFY